MLLVTLVAGMTLSAPVAEPDTEKLPIPFERYYTRDEFGRKITWYLSKTKAKEALPLVVFIQGSGSFSLFAKVGDHIGGGLQMLLLNQVRDKARVLVIEKVGVKYLELPKQPGSATEASAEYRQEDTLPRWAAAVSAAIRSARTLPGIDAKRALVVGHSEGGRVAGRVALNDPAVTHVACLSTNGPTQLYDLMELARQGKLGNDPRPPAERVQHVVDEWKLIRADPDNPDKFFAGHPYRHWSSYIPNTLLDDLIGAKARVYLAQGTLDTSVPVSSFDVLYAELLARGKDVTAERVEGVDHGFYKAGDPPGPPAGMEKVFGHVVDWFFGNKKEK